MNSFKHEVANVISVCTIKDIHSWMYAVKYILKHIRSEAYHLIIPARYREAFKLVTPEVVKIHCEEYFAPEFPLSDIQRLMPATNKERAGWYYQQLLKIKALAELGEHNRDVNLIWDADTVPFQALKFVVEDKLVYHVGTEHHLPYFKTIQKLLNKPKITSFSFISQCFPARKIWVNEFLKEVEQIHKTSWYHAILDCTDLGEGSGFSEYETLGTYFAHRYPEQMLESKGLWERTGSKIAKLRDLETYLKKCDGAILYAAYEAWDPAEIQAAIKAKENLPQKLGTQLSSNSWTIVKSLSVDSKRANLAIIEKFIQKSAETEQIEIKSSSNVLEIKGTSKGYHAWDRTDRSSEEANAKNSLPHDKNFEFESNGDEIIEWTYRANLITKDGHERNLIGWRRSVLKKYVVNIFEVYGSKRVAKPESPRTYLSLQNIKNPICKQIFEQINWVHPPDIIEIGENGADVREFLVSLKFELVLLQDGRCAFVHPDLLN